MEQNDESIPEAMPISETMERYDPPQITQQQINPNGAVALIGSSCGAQCTRLGGCCSGTQYGVFTMHPNANGVPMRFGNSTEPAMAAKFVGQRLILFEGPSKNGVILATLSLGNGCFGESDAKLTTPTGGMIGGIVKPDACTTAYYISGAGGEQLYCVAGESWCSQDMVITQSNKNTVIGRMDVEQGCCSGGRYSISYPQDLHLDHKLLLIACMNMVQMAKDSENNAGAP